MKPVLIALALSGCTYATAEPSECAPATPAYVAQTHAGCQMPDGGYFTEADGRVAPTLIVCTAPDGAVFESWCQ
jgi:hypothetical protein